MHNRSDSILIIAGDGTCYNALNEFALSFAEGLKKRGYATVLMYMNMLDESAMKLLVDTEYAAIVGFQTNLFSLCNSEGIYIGNMIESHKYNYILDPPETKLLYFAPRIDKLTMFYHDKGYVEYINRYFPHVDVRYSPPAGGVAGIEGESGLFEKPRSLDVTFVGNYIDYRRVLESAVENLPEWKDIIVSFFEYLIIHPNTDAVHALRDFIDINSLDISEEEFPALLKTLYPSRNAAASYCREKVIKILTENNITVDAFSQSWRKSPFAECDRLQIHPDVSYRDSMKVLTDSKLALNVFSWHKSSVTERILNIMLSGAVCVSDCSDKLMELFDKNKEIVLYDLEKLEELPDKVAGLLNNNDERLMLAKAGYENVYKNHRWINRVDDFVDIISKECM